MWNLKLHRDILQANHLKEAISKHYKSTAVCLILLHTPLSLQYIASICQEPRPLLHACFSIEEEQHCLRNQVYCCKNKSIENYY